MSPIPYVRGQAIAVAVLVTASALLGPSVIAVACGIFAIAWMLGLRAKYRRDVAAAETSTPPHRERLDRVVAGDALVSVLPATLASASLLALSLDPLSVSDAARGAVDALAITATAVYASSLVDWYVILPRISGQLGARPCRAASETEKFPFPGTWKEVTRWWYIHRVAATFVFRVGLSAAIAIVIGALSGLDAEARWLAAGAMAMFSAYAVSALQRGVGQAGHAKAIVGQTVRIERRPGKRRLWPPFRKSPALRFDGRHLVVDVALESVQLIAAEPHEEADLPNPLRYEKDPDSVSLADIDAVRRASPRFAGCESRCSGINWYCIENPRCFDPK